MHGLPFQAFGINHWCGQKRYEGGCCMCNWPGMVDHFILRIKVNIEELIGRPTWKITEDIYAFLSLIFTSTHTGVNRNGIHDYEDYNYEILQWLMSMSPSQYTVQMRIMWMSYLLMSSHRSCRWPGRNRWSWWWLRVNHILPTFDGGFQTLVN